MRRWPLRQRPLSPLAATGTDAAVEVAHSTRATPAMRSASALTHQGSGIYRGSGQFSMEGTWNVIVTASRGADEIGRSNFSVVVR